MKQTAIKPTLPSLKKYAATFGAEVEVGDYGQYATADITVIAPDGMQWVDGQCIHMTECFWFYIAGSKAEAIQRIIERMSAGLETDTNND